MQGTFGRGTSASQSIAPVTLRSWTTQKDFHIKELLTKGSYGKVYLASHANTGRELIVKAVHKYAARGPGELSPEEELGLHHYVSKKMPDRLHVAKLIAGYEDDHHVYSVMEACRGPTIAALLDAANGPITEAQAAYLLKQAVTTIQQLHSIGVLHRDVKPDNFMFYQAEPASPLVVIDFGLSLLLGDASSHCSKWTVGSLLYVAPEVTNCGFYTYACDVWSLGILLYRMLFNREPFSSIEDSADSSAVPLPSDASMRASEEALNLVLSMLKHKHSNRLSVEQVLAHPFMHNACADIEPLMNAWHMQKTADANPSPDACGTRNSSAVSSSHRPTATSFASVATSLPQAIPTPRMLPSSLLSISPEGMAASPRPSSISTTTSDAHLPDYPDLPSLTMPTSVRRAFSTASLHAQCRVQTLSAAADQTWRVPTRANLMRAATLQEPVAASSETRETARALQSARPQHSLLAAMLSDLPDQDAASPLLKPCLSNIETASTYVDASMGGSPFNYAGTGAPGAAAEGLGYSMSDERWGSAQGELSASGLGTTCEVIPEEGEGEGSPGSPYGPFEVGSAPAHYHDAAVALSPVSTTLTGELKRVSMSSGTSSVPPSARSLPGTQQTPESPKIPVFVGDPDTALRPTALPAVKHVATFTQACSSQASIDGPSPVSNSHRQSSNTLRSALPVTASPLSHPCPLSRNSREFSGRFGTPPEAPEAPTGSHTGKAGPCLAERLYLQVTPDRRTSMDSRRILESLLEDHGCR